MRDLGIGRNLVLIALLSTEPQSLPLKANSPLTRGALRGMEMLGQPVHPAGRRARLAHRLGQTLGFHVLPRHFYSPIPDLDQMPDEFFGRRCHLPGINIDLDGQLALLASSLSPFVAEFPERGPDNFVMRNGGYENVDAEILYAMVRHTKPRRLVEIGTGFSTLVSAAGAKVNASEGAPLKFVSIDPNPSVNTRKTLDASLDVEQRPVAVQDVPIDEFVALDAGDILFVDGTHVVRSGGDVNFVVLEILPRLRPGVLVHFHDIYLPYEYPRYFVERFYWTEQYLLQAFLALNPLFKIHFATHYLARMEPGLLARTVPSFDPKAFPSGFWLRRE
ncbi:MAG: class I SAM-dependent methyltransferase [Gemmatimonadaceae bacterium]